MPAHSSRTAVDRLLCFCCAQTSIQAEGFRSLRESESVEYELEEGEDGRCKAVKVTGPDGAPPLVRPRTWVANPCLRYTHLHGRPVPRPPQRRQPPTARASARNSRQSQTELSAGISRRRCWCLLYKKRILATDAGGPTTDVVSSASAAAVPCVRLSATALRVRLRRRRVWPRKGAGRRAAWPPRPPSTARRSRSSGGRGRGVPRGHDAAAAGPRGRAGLRPHAHAGVRAGVWAGGLRRHADGDAGEASAPRHARRVERSPGAPLTVPSACCLYSSSSALSRAQLQSIYVFAAIAPHVHSHTIAAHCAPRLPGDGFRMCT